MSAAGSKPSIDLRSLLVGPARRRLPTATVLATFCACSLIVWTIAARLASTVDLIPFIRIATVLLAASAATCLEEANQSVIDSTSFGRFRHRTLTVLVSGSATVALWSILVVGAMLIDRGATDGPLPFIGLLIELVALCTCGWLVAVVLVQRSSWRGTGARAAAAVVVMALFSLADVRSNEWLWPSPGPKWRAAHQHWASIALVALVVLLAISRDPAIRNRPRWRRP